MQIDRLEEFRTMQKSLVGQMTSPSFVQAISILANQSRPTVCGCGEPLQRVYGSMVKICPNCLT